MYSQYSPMISDQVVTVVFDYGRAVKQVARDSEEGIEIVDAIRSGVSADELYELFDVLTKVQRHFDGELEFVNGAVLYAGVPVHGVVVDRIIEFTRSGLPTKGLIEFLKKLMKNPSQRSIEQLYSFLENENLVITNDGDVLSYKGVTTDGWSIHGDRHAPVIQGVMDDSGRLRNWVGDVLEVRRGYVVDDPNVHCSNGLHTGSLEYSKALGPRTVVVRWSPTDAVSVPSDHEAQKLRVCKYTVVGEFERPLTQSEETQVELVGPFDIVVYDDAGNPMRRYEDLEADDDVREKISQLADLGFDDFTVIDGEGEGVTSHFR